MTDRKFGFIKQKEDNRDFTFTARPAQVIAIPTSADLRQFDTPILDQGNIGSCTSQALAAVVQWLQNKTMGTYTPVSRLFNYYFSRILEDVKGDEGSTLRAAAKSLNHDGDPPENLWPYVESKVNATPSNAAHDEALNWQSLKYYICNTNQDKKAALGVSGLPFMGGFTVYDTRNSIYDVGASGNIPVPTNSERNNVLGGHAIAFMGFEDAHINSDSSRGAWLIKNSWNGWGSNCPTTQLPNGTKTNGYAWLPYSYNPDDCWVVAEEEMLNVTPITPPTPVPPVPPTPEPPHTLCESIMNALKESLI